jgi:uncharacterized protein
MNKLVTELNNYFKELFKNDKSIDRYGIPFVTSNNKYFYDSGTGKVLQCSEAVYSLLLNLFLHNGRIDIDTLDLTEAELGEAAEDIRENVNQENIFKANKEACFNCSHVHYLREIIEQGCTQLILEVTENCNLRCRYCIYGEEVHNFRSFGMNNMSFETAKKAIDYFLSVADYERALSLTFYGGEPLINFDLIKKSTDYFKEQIRKRTDKPGKFGMTSNLTLLNKDMADFFADNDFDIMCSLDGDEAVHNVNRPFANGQGSFDATLAGLNMLVEAYGDKAETLIGINTVIDQPYSPEKFQSLNDFFAGLSCISDKTAIITTYAGKDEIYEETDISPNMELVTNKNFRIDDMGDWEFERIRQGESIRLKEFAESTLIDIHTRRISHTPFENGSLNACCIPGTRRLYVTVDGRFQPCERIGKSPYIGDVNTGIDIDSIRKYYVDDYIEKSRENCENCWASQLCDVCYARCFDENGLDMRRKKALCEASRYSMYTALVRYHTLLEENPDILEPFNEINFF